MARYDRIAQLSAPVRAQTFPGWSVLRDCEANPRDIDAVRRARLRFLTLRPIMRVARAGIGAVQQESLILQVERVADELTQLPARDAERAQMRHVVDALHEGNLESISRAILELVDFELANGTPFAAEEFATCCVELMGTSERPDLHAAAVMALSRVMAATGKPELAIELAAEACDRAQAADDRSGWLRAAGQLALAHQANGDAARTEELLGQALRRAREWNDEALTGLAHAQACRAHFDAQHYEIAVEHGWSALRTLESGAERTSVLLLVAQALSRIDLWRAAERCFVLVGQHARDHATRAAAAAGTALCAAFERDLPRLLDRRAAAHRELPHLAAYARAEVYVTLATAALLADDAQTARTELSEAINLLGRKGPPSLVARADALLTALERHTQDVSRVAIRPVNDQIRRIAAELERVADPLAPVR